MSEEKYIDLYAFVNELLDVCDKYELREYFETYIAEFVKDMRGYGLVHNKDGEVYK